MGVDFKSIILLLITQAMINLGEIKNPIEKASKLNLKGAKVFLDLLAVLKDKTKGNLTKSEETYLSQVLLNVNEVYKKKLIGRN